MSELKVSNYRIIDYEENYGAKLTYYGTIIGGKIIRKKRIKELFLKKIGMTFQEIVQQIDQIHISERISNLIKEQILHPIEELKIENRENVRCHHGALIPDENGKVKLEMFYPMNYFPEVQI